MPDEAYVRVRIWVVSSDRSPVGMKDDSILSAMVGVGTRGRLGVDSERLSDDTYPAVGRGQTVRRCWSSIYVFGASLFLF